MTRSPSGGARSTRSVAPATSAWIPASPSARAPATGSASFTSNPRARPAASTSSTGPDVINRPRAKIATRSQAAHLAQQMTRHEHRAPFVPEASGAARGTPRCRPGRARWPARRGSAARDPQERGPMPEPLLHPERVGLHLVVGAVGEADLFEHRVDAPCVRCRQRPRNCEVPSPGEPREQRRRLDDRTTAADHRRETTRDSRHRTAAARPAVGRTRPSRHRSVVVFPRRSGRGTRTRRPRARRGRGRRPPASAAAHAPVLLAEPLDLDHAPPRRRYPVPGRRPAKDGPTRRRRRPVAPSPTDGRGCRAG